MRVQRSEGSRIQGGGTERTMDDRPALRDWDEGRINSELLFCLINPASSAGQARAPVIEQRLS